MIIAVLVFVALVILFFALNNKGDDVEREGLVKDLLSKDALHVQFDDGKTVLVKFIGVSMAGETEMMDENIVKYLEEQIVGHRMKVKPVRVDNGDVFVSEVYTLGGEYVNASLIEQGFARWNPTEAGSDGRLTTAQEFAKGSMLGIWNPAIQKIAQDNREELEANLEGEDSEVEGGDDLSAATS